MCLNQIKLLVRIDCKMNRKLPKSMYLTLRTMMIRTTGTQPESGFGHLFQDILTVLFCISPSENVRWSLTIGSLIVNTSTDIW